MHCKIPISFLRILLASSDTSTHGSHVLGTVFDLADVEDDEEDLDEIVERTIKKKAHATQARAILAKVPCQFLHHARYPSYYYFKTSLPKSPPLSLLCYPRMERKTLMMSTLINGSSRRTPTCCVNSRWCCHWAFCEIQDGSRVIWLGSANLRVRPLWNFVQGTCFRRNRSYIFITDFAHARKTCRNQPQYGTHAASLGVGHLVNQSLVHLYRLPGSGLVIRDVEMTEQQGIFFI